jgi:RNA polymerase sigma-70 factor (ECF subfamily)
MQVQDATLPEENRLKSAATIPFPGCSLKTSTSPEGASADKFRGLVEAHQSRVYSIAFRMLGDSGLAEEVAQDVFLALSRNLDRIENDDHLLAWLRRVAVQRATDASRRRSSRVDFAASEFQEERAPGSPAWNGGPSGNAATRFEQLVASLPERQRAIVLLRYQEDMTPTEIAAMLQMPVATVKSHLQRALKLLRKAAETRKRR